MSDQTIPPSQRLCLVERVHYTHDAIMSLKTRVKDLEEALEYAMQMVRKSMELAEEAKKDADDVRGMIGIEQVSLNQFIDYEAEEVSEDDSSIGDSNEVDEDKDDDDEVVFVSETKKRRLS